MALVARGHATLRCAIVRRAETSGPPQEARHTCSGVCVPIIRSASAPSFPPLSPVPLPVLSLLPALSLYSAFHIRRPGKKKKSAPICANICDVRAYRFVPALAAVRTFDRWFVCSVRRNVHEEK